MVVVVRGVTVSMSDHVWVKLTPLGAGLWTQWRPIPDGGGMVVPFWELMLVLGPHVRSEERRNELFSGGELTFLAETEHQACSTCKGAPLLQREGKPEQVYVCKTCGGSGRMLV